MVVGMYVPPRLPLFYPNETLKREEKGVKGKQLVVSLCGVFSCW